MPFAIIQQRLHNQGLEGPGFGSVAEAVAWLGAVQAQDYAAAKWALGLRVRNATDAAVEQAFAKGEILRTHVLRPTWHFVMPADIRWLLALTGPRIKATLNSYCRKHGLDETTLRRSNDIIGHALVGGRHLTRPELATLLRRRRIAVNGMEASFIMMRAEQDAVVCSGPIREKQFTYALLEERVPKALPFDRDEALAELAARYFTSHGPATLRDFAWWSGLRMNEAKIGLDLARARLEHHVVDGTSLWFAPSTRVRTNHRNAVHLLPNYDEYFIAYKDRELVLDGAGAMGIMFTHQIAIGGQVRGSWKRLSRASGCVIEARPLVPLSTAHERALDAAADRHSRFLGVPVSLTVASPSAVKTTRRI